MVSVCVSLLSRDSDWLLSLVNRTRAGNTCGVLRAPKIVSGSKQCLSGPSSLPVLIAKKLRNPRASTAPSTRLSNSSSSERYDQPAEANCTASVDLPLPEGPTISTPLSSCGSTTPALCRSNNPNRRRPAQTSKDVAGGGSGSP